MDRAVQCLGVLCNVPDTHCNFSCFTRQSLMWMQDGDPAHCTTATREFLLNKFGGRVISLTQIAWPAHSPDLNSLDFYCWALVQKEAYSAKPTTVDELINIVKRFSEEHR